MKKNTQLLTVIVPVFNKLNLLKDTINSIFIQDYPNIELIITDDASPNYSLFFIENLVATPPENIQSIQIIHHETNLGTVKNLNNAIKKANGEYISILAGDDMYYCSSTLSTLVKDLKNDQVIVGNMLQIQENGKQTSDVHWSVPPIIANFYPLSWIYYILLSYSNLYCISGMVCKKELFINNGLFDERETYLEDYPYWLKLLRLGVRVKTVSYLTTKYRLGGVFTNTSFSEKIDKEMYIALTNEHEFLDLRTWWGKFVAQGLSHRINHDYHRIDIKKIGQKYQKTFIYKVLNKILVILIIRMRNIITKK